MNVSQNQSELKKAKGQLKSTPGKKSRSIKKTLKQNKKNQINSTTQIHIKLIFPTNVN